MTFRLIPALSDPVVIPLPVDTPLFTLRVTLAGTEFVLRFDYHERIERWRLDVLAADGSVIAAGLRVVTSWPLLRRVSDARRPQGELLAYDPTDGGPPLFADLGRRVLLLFAPYDLTAGASGTNVGDV